MATIKTKYGPVEVNVGDSFQQKNTLSSPDYNWTITHISRQYFVEGMYEFSSPLILLNDPAQQDLSSHEAHNVVTTPGLACLLLDELNERSFVVGQNGAASGEWIGARLHEFRNNLPRNEEAKWANTEDVYLNGFIDEELEIEGLGREIVHAIQQARRKAGLEVVDNIHLMLETDNELLKKTLQQVLNFILFEAQAEMKDPGEGATVVEAKIDKKYPMTIRFKKVTNEREEEPS